MVYLVIREWLSYLLFFVDYIPSTQKEIFTVVILTEQTDTHSFELWLLWIAYIVFDRIAYIFDHEYDDISLD